MKIHQIFDLSRSEWENAINEWIFNETHRAMLKRNLLDGRTYEQIAEQFDLSARQVARLIPKLQNQLFKHIKLAYSCHCECAFFVLS